MESKYIVNVDEYLEKNNIKENISEYVANEVGGADMFFKYFIYCIFQ